VTERLEPATSYREWAPPAAWRHAVACLWEQSAVADHEQRVLPDGCADIIIDNGGSAIVVGVHDAVARPRLAPGTILRAVRFRPEIVGRAFDADGAALLNQTLDLDTVVPPALVRASTNALVDGDLADLDQWLRDLRPDRRAAAAVEALAATGDVTTVADEVGLSGRQLRRLLLTEVGVGPKTLQRVARLQRFLALAEGEGGGLALVASLAGYADQSHLTREVRDLTGLPPAALLAERAA